MAGLSIGTWINKVLDRFLPDVVGDIVGAAVDAATGNVAGAVLNGVDALEDGFEALAKHTELRGFSMAASLSSDLVELAGPLVGSGVSPGAGELIGKLGGGGGVDLLRSLPIAQDPDVQGLIGLIESLVAQRGGAGAAPPGYLIPQ